MQKNSEMLKFDMFEIEKTVLDKIPKKNQFARVILFLNCYYRKIVLCLKSALP